MQHNTLLAILTLAGIEAKSAKQIVNAYWPAHSDYDDMRAKYPWWAVEVEEGTITIGWRKRVIAIDWSMTSRRGLVTHDDVTKDNAMVHAYSYEKAVEYLRAWKSLPVVDVTEGNHQSFALEGREKVIESLRLFGPGGWEQDLLKNLLDDVHDESEVTALVRPAGDGEYGFTIKVGSMTVQHYPRKKDV